MGYACESSVRNMNGCGSRKEGNWGKEKWKGVEERSAKKDFFIFSRSSLPFIPQATLRHFFSCSSFSLG